ncbi:MAG: hypothetical protein NTU81_00430 [Candidatus Nomurabacteria bacterium]|nr:hypothetical protein [Candidatus Nomurabacteria bacterium]
MDQVSVLTLVNLSKDIAQLNLGYLGISVAILGVLGGVFIYFNIKPLKEALDKQEIKIDDLKKEAHDLLDQSKEQSDKTLEEFKSNQLDTLDKIFKQQKNEIDLETKNKIQESQNILSDKIENISEDKDKKIKEIILSETNNNISKLDKDLTLNINTLKEGVSTEIKSLNSDLKLKIKILGEKIKELQVYRYSKEGQMGAIIYSIELLEDAIDDYVKFKDLFKDDFNKEKFGWKINFRLEGLIKEIGDLSIEEEYKTKINLQIKKVENEIIFGTLIDSLKKKL